MITGAGLLGRKNMVDLLRASLLGGEGLKPLSGCYAYVAWSTSLSGRNIIEWLNWIVLILYSWNDQELDLHGPKILGPTNPTVRKGGAQLPKAQSQFVIKTMILLDLSSNAWLNRYSSIPWCYGSDIPVFVLCIHVCMRNGCVNKARVLLLLAGARVYIWTYWCVTTYIWARIMSG